MYFWWLNWKDAVSWVQSLCLGKLKGCEDGKVLMAEPACEQDLPSLNCALQSG